MISLFPGVIVVSALPGLTSPSATRFLIGIIDELGHGGDNSVAVQVLEQPRDSRSLVGVARAPWTASGYIGTFVRAANVVYDTEEDRPIGKTVPLRLGLTVLLVVVCAVEVLVSSRVAETVGQWLVWVRWRSPSGKSRNGRSCLGSVLASAGFASYSESLSSMVPATAGTGVIRADSARASHSAVSLSGLVIRTCDVSRDQPGAPHDQEREQQQ